MSGKKHFDARLEDHRLVFPDRIREMNEVVDNMPMNGLILQRVGNTIKGYKGISRPTTSDGYCWFWAIKFRLPIFKRILVAFPWSQDWDKEDGLQLDRSIAFHTSNDVSTKDINALFDKLLNALKEV